MMQRIDWSEHYPDYQTRLDRMSDFIRMYRIVGINNELDFHPDFFLGLTLEPVNYDHQILSEHAASRYDRRELRAFASW